MGSRGSVLCFSGFGYWSGSSLGVRCSALAWSYVLGSSVSVNGGFIVRYPYLSLPLHTSLVFSALAGSR